MASLGMHEKAKEHLKRINDEISEFERYDVLPGSIAYKYLDQLRVHREHWMKFLDQ